MTHPYQDDQLDVDQRVDDLLERMTLEDKAGMLFHMLVFAGDLDAEDPMFPVEAPRKMITEAGLRHFNILGSTPDGRSFAAWHNEMQRIAATHPLAIPVTLSTDPRNHFTDNPMMSMMAGAFSQWPEPLGLAAIGSVELVHEFADIARQEYLAVGIRVALHPQIDLATEPRWSRISSTFGEDSQLTSRLVAAYVEGFQTETLGPNSVATMTKHFPGGGPQLDGDGPHFPWGREQVYPGDHFGYHLEPFRAAIQAGTSQMMPYYGMPIGTEHEEVGFSFSRSIITGLLREQLGFEGIVCTDWGLITDKAPEMGDLGRAKAWGVEHLDEDERMVKLLDAGIDQFGGEHCVDRLVRLVQSGRVAETRVDESARRLLREKFVLGLFDQRFVDEDQATTVLERPSHHAAGRRAQQRAVTVLVNDSVTLPLSSGIAVYAEGFAEGNAANEALEGYGVVVDGPEDAEVAIIRLKTPWVPRGGGGIADMFHGGSLEFLADEVERLLAICRTVPTVIDIYIERPAVIEPLVKEAAAIVANYGIADRALVEVLFGEVEPEGNLPFDLPRSMDAVVESRSDVPFDTAEPTFGFGHGLRYAPDMEAMFATLESMGPAGLAAMMPPGPDPSTYMNDPVLAAIKTRNIAIPGPHGDVPTRLYRHPTEPSRGAFVWVHGGGFAAGDLDMPEAHWVSLMLAARGFGVLSVDYQKCLGDVHFPVPSDEVLAAWQWAVEHAEELTAAGVLHLGGASAGASLAAGVAKRLRDGEGQPPASVVLVYPTLHAELPEMADELTAATKAIRAAMSDRIFRWMQLNYAGTEEVFEDPYAFPGVGDVSGQPPIYILNSDTDVLRASGEAYAADLAAAGVDVTCEHEPGTGHGHLNEPGLAEATQSIERIAAWLGRAL